MTEYHVNPSLTPEENIEAAIASLKARRPSQGKDKNSGVYGTPIDFLKAVERVFPIDFDLAADEMNSVMRRLHHEDGLYYDAATDSLKQDWTFHAIENLMIGNGWYWLNPPFSNIGPWAKKCAVETAKGARVLLLVPQGTQEWARKWCRPNALEIRLEGRMIFEGETAPYPKDLTLWVFGHGIVGTATWNWREGVVRVAGALAVTEPT